MGFEPRLCTSRHIHFLCDTKPAVFMSNKSGK